MCVFNFWSDVVGGSLLIIQDGDDHSTIQMVFSFKDEYALSAPKAYQRETVFVRMHDGCFETALGVLGTWCVFFRIWNWQSCAKAYKAYKRPVLTRAISKSLKCRGVWCRHKLVCGDWNGLIYGVRDGLFIFQMACYQFFVAVLGYTCSSAHWKMRHINENGFRITSLEGGFLFHRWSQLVTWGWWCRHRYLWIIIAVYHFNMLNALS